MKESKKTVVNYKKLNLKNRIVIVAGMPRCGTTFLYYHIGNHPNIFLPYYKEIDYFGYHYEIGIKYYLRNFKAMPQNSVGFDISPGYVMDREAVDVIIQRIKEFNPNIKIILGVRNPVEYALSIYHQINKYWYGMPPFEEFIEKFELKLGYNHVNMKLKDMVFEVLEKYKKAFGENLLIYNFDIIRKDPLILLNSIETFVGVPNYFDNNNFKNKIINASDHSEIKAIYYLKAWLKSHRIPKTSNMFTDKLNKISQINPFSMINKSKKEVSFQKNHSHNYQIAKQFFKKQEDDFSRLFEKADIQLGNGKSFYF